MSDTIARIRRHHIEGEAEGFYRSAPKFRQVHDDRSALLLIVDRLEKKLTAANARADDRQKQIGDLLAELMAANARADAAEEMLKRIHRLQYFFADVAVGKTERVYSFDQVQEALEQKP
jgi:hypothetical protein